MDQRHTSSYRSNHLSAPGLEEENASLRAQCRRIGELEDKVEMVLRNNSQLLLENQKLAKMLHQQKADYEVMRNKYQMINTQRAGLATNLDFELKKLHSENQHLKIQLAELERLKNVQVADARNQLSIELQALKKQHLSNTEMYEMQIRKLKDLLQRRNYEIEEQRIRLDRLCSDTEFQIARAKQEKQRLKGEVGILQIQKKKESEMIRAKIEAYYLSEIESIKKGHLANLEAIEYENMRLKEACNAKSQQIQSLLLKQQKLKQLSEQSNDLLRAENQILNQKLHECEKVNEIEAENFRTKLLKNYQFQIEVVKNSHSNMTEMLKQDVAKLEVLLASKHQQLQQLIKEKSHNKHLAETENGRLRLEIEGLTRQLIDLEKNKDLVGIELGQKLADREEHIQYLNSLSLTQNNKFDKELESLRKLLQYKDMEIESKAAQGRQVEAHLKDQVAVLTRQNQTLRDDIRRIQTLRTNEQQDLKDHYELQVSQLKEKVEGVSHRTNLAKKETDALKQNLQLKDKETNLMKKRLQASDDAERKYTKEIQDIKNKLINKDRDCNKMLEEQRLRLEKTFNYHLENLKADHANSLKSQKMKISELEDLLRKKENELDDLLKRYKKMEQEIYQLTQQQANKKELTLKFPGATADLIATKNLFDVFIKSKLLDLTEEERLGKRPDGS